MTQMEVSALRRHIDIRRKMAIAICTSVMDGNEMNGVNLGRFIEYQGRLAELDDVLKVVELAEVRGVYQDEAA